MRTFSITLYNTGPQVKELRNGDLRGSERCPVTCIGINEVLPLEYNTRVRTATLILPSIQYFNITRSFSMTFTNQHQSLVLKQGHSTTHVCCGQKFPSHCASKSFTLKFANGNWSLLFTKLWLYLCSLPMLMHYACWHSKQEFTLEVRD